MAQEHHTHTHAHTTHTHTHTRTHTTARAPHVRGKSNHQVPTILRHCRRRKGGRTALRRALHAPRRHKLLCLALGTPHRRAQQQPPRITGVCLASRTVRRHLLRVSALGNGAEALRPLRRIAPALQRFQGRGWRRDTVVVQPCQGPVLTGALLQQRAGHVHSRAVVVRRDTRIRAGTRSGTVRLHLCLCLCLCL